MRITYFGTVYLVSTEEELLRLLSALNFPR